MGQLNRMYTLYNTRREQTGFMMTLESPPRAKSFRWERSESNRAVQGPNTKWVDTPCGVPTQRIFLHAPRWGRGIMQLLSREQREAV